MEMLGVKFYIQKCEGDTNIQHHNHSFMLTLKTYASIPP